MLSLAYRASEPGSEQSIERAQEELRAQPGQVGSHVRLAQAFLQRKRETGDIALLAYAKDAIRGARQLAPHEPDVLIVDALIAQDQHQFERVAQLAGQLVKLSPNDATGHLLLGDAHLELGDYAKAVDAVQGAIDLAPDFRSYSRGAYMSWLHNDYQGALELFEAALQSPSRSPEPMAWVWTDLGQMYWHTGRIDAALRSTDRALALVASYPAAQSLRARCLAAQGNTSEAIELYLSLAKRRPVAEDLLRLAELHTATSNFDAATRAETRALALAGHDPLPVASYLSRHNKQIDRALELSRAAAAEQPNIYSHDALALALTRSGQIAAARAEFKLATALDTPDATLYLHGALLELRANNTSKARALLDKSISLNPHADPLLTAEITATLGQPSVLSQELADAR